MGNRIHTIDGPRLNGKRVQTWHEVYLTDKGSLFSSLLFVFEILEDIAIFYGATGTTGLVFCSRFQNQNGSSGFCVSLLFLI